MTIARKVEQRILAQDERDVVARTHHPGICRLSREELADMRRLLRTWHEKARDVAQRQRREMRGKVEPRGAVAARDNTGTVTKQQILAQALKRVNREIARPDAGRSPDRHAAHASM